MRHRTPGLQANTISGAPDYGLKFFFLSSSPCICLALCLALSLFLRSDQSSLPKNISFRRCPLVDQDRLCLPCFSCLPPYDSLTLLLLASTLCIYGLISFIDQSRYESSFPDLVFTATTVPGHVPQLHKHWYCF